MTIQPTASIQGTAYDAAYSNPVSADQQVLIPSTQAGDYYVLVKSRQSARGQSARLGPAAGR